MTLTAGVRFGEDVGMERAVRIGKYLARRTLGAGSFATVWLADDELLDAQVAVKVLADNWARHPDVRRRFIEEAKLLRRIDHERIVRVHDVDELPDGRPYFVMTWADRGTLQERLAAAPGGLRQLPVDQAVRLAIEMCECLAVVHDFGAVHRDVKPSNVLFRSVRSHERAAAQRRGLELGDEQLVLGDFGLAKDLAAASGFTMAAGTPAYMAPEQARPTAIIDRRVDVYGVSAVLYEMLAGRPAIAASTLSDVRRGADDGAVTPLRQVRPEVPPPVAAVVARGMAFQAEQRYAGALELADALHRSLAAVARRGGADARAGAVGAIAPAAAPPVGAAGRVRDLVAHVRSLGLDAKVALDAIEAGLAEPVLVVVDGPPGGPSPTLDLPDGAVRRDGDASAADVLVLVLTTVDAAEHVAAVRAGLRSGPWAPASVVAVVDDVSTTGASPDIRALTTDIVAVPDAGPVVTAIAETLVQRRSLLRAAVALADLEAVLRSSAERPAQDRDLRDRVEALRLELPALGEIDALRAEATGRWTLAGPLRREVRRILLWTAPAQRLGRAGGSSAELQAATREGLERWRTLRNSDRVPFSARDVAELVERSLERLWVELAPGGE